MGKMGQPETDLKSPNALNTNTSWRLVTYRQAVYQ